MDISKLKDMNRRFDERLNELILPKGQNAQIFTNESYAEMIEKVKSAKSKTSHKKPEDYQRLRRFDVMTVGETEKLIVPVKDNTIRFYVRNDEIFQILHDIHMALGHVGRNRMERQVNLHFKNITREMIVIYLNLCDGCEEKRSVNKKGSLIKLTSGEMSENEKVLRILQLMKNSAHHTEINCAPYEAKNTNEQDAQPGPSQAQSPTKTRETPVSCTRQDPLNKGSTNQCRFCGDFSKDCSTVDHKPYVTKNKTELAFNDINVSLDFNDNSLPKTVCSACDAKLQEIHDFVKTVKAAQNALINIGATEKEEDEVETLVVKTEYEETEDDVDKKDGILDSITVGETVFIKVTKTPRKRKSKTDTEPRSETITVTKAKKANVTKTSQSEKSEDESMDFFIDIKEEVIEKEDNCNTELEAFVKGTDVKPSELELATSALVYQMGNIEASGLSEGNS